ncbi:hypothetical protein D3C84_511370 [compost metagenome]
MARQLLQRLLQLTQGRQQLRQQSLPRLGRHHGPGAAIEQPDSQTTLQPLEGVAQGRGRDPELEGGPAETAVAGDGGKYRQFGKIGAGDGHVQQAEERENQGYAKGGRETIGPLSRGL